MQSTLREMQRLLRDSRSWAVLVVLSLIAGMIGPFGTYEAIPVVPRLAYWSAIVVGTAAMGTLVASVVERLLRPRLPEWLAALIAGGAAGPFIAALVALLNWAVFGPDITVIDLMTLTIYCTLISMAVTLLSALLGARPAGAVPVDAGAATEAEPALLARLPRGLRGRLVHLAVSDHYVDVTTDKGTTLVLMRLSDAMRETAPVPGLQVHRSHWVALDAVRRSTRQAGKPMLELVTGTMVPVSRTYLEATRAAGLLD
ncbi:transcriptional regulator, LytTR family [Devosia lucknowensis]|uniref:Transcriptional regulator, LytTR family n=2 Tax=Devosia lucknowensis TaxID=1096929 RepID=A0A1Y6G7A2_9HYPH|nr:transcriptional regulator, LytTR family [Devosia lucknowensis]